jgi:serine/threonine protein kinase
MVPYPARMALHGRYTILGKLADGGMAEIFLAVQNGAEGFEKSVVLKRILTQFSADPQFRNMFLDEAHISMSLQHSNIVQVLDLGVANGRYFLVMELCDGWDLERILQRAQSAGMVFPPALSLYVVAVICRALAYAHAKSRDGKPLGIVHRDISPNNVLISEQGEVKLTDFGIAKAQRKREQTAAGVIKGKVAYMSPEQALGTIIDKRSDIFSVGSLLYRMMTDKLPFDAPSDLEQLLRVQKAEVTPPEKIKSTVGEAVSGIIMRAMRTQPKERYQTADEMLADVERVLRNEFQSAGQTELKLWLEQLARRDSVDSIGKRRLDTSGIIKDDLGTDLSAGTSFELDDLDQVVSGMTEVGSRPPPTPPPLPVSSPMPSRPETTVDRIGPRQPPSPTPPPSLTPSPIVTASVSPPRRRLAGFWFGAIFALGAVIGGRYLLGWAEQEGVVDKLGLGPDGRVRSPEGTAVVEGPAQQPPARPVPAPPAHALPVPGTIAAPRVDAAPVVAVGPVGPAAPAASAWAAALVHDAAASAAPSGRDAAAAEVEAVAAALADDEPDEEALLRDAVPNAEEAVIGANGAEPAPKAAEAASKHNPMADAKPAHPAAPAGAPKPKAAPVIKETAILHITTRPVGAIVRTKGQVLGRTPINLHFRTGNTYELTFVKKGYLPANRRVAVTNAKDKKLALALRKRPRLRKRVFFHPHR